MFAVDLIGLDCTQSRGAVRESLNMSRLQSLRVLTLVLVAAVSAVDAGSNISRALLSTGNLLLKFCTGFYCYAISIVHR